MAEEGISFKVSLWNKDETGKSEVRRFFMPKTHSFLALKKKLKSIFSELENSGFKITWIDDDNDFVNVDSDEELFIALDEMKGPIYKFSMTRKKYQGFSWGEIHENVICDACDGPVVGNRYRQTFLIYLE